MNAFHTQHLMLIDMNDADAIVDDVFVVVNCDLHVNFLLTLRFVLVDDDDVKSMTKWVSAFCRQEIVGSTNPLIG